MGANDGAVLGHAGCLGQRTVVMIEGKLQNYIHIIYGNVCTIYIEDGIL